MAAPPEVPPGGSVTAQQKVGASAPEPRLEIVRLDCQRRVATGQPGVETALVDQAVSQRREHGGRAVIRRRDGPQLSLVLRVTPRESP